MSPKLKSRTSARPRSPLRRHIHNPIPAVSGEASRSRPPSQHQLLILRRTRSVNLQHPWWTLNERAGSRLTGAAAWFHPSPGRPPTGASSPRRWIGGGEAQTNRWWSSARSCCSLRPPHWPLLSPATSPSSCRRPPLRHAAAGHLPSSPLLPPATSPSSCRRCKPLGWAPIYLLWEFSPGSKHLKIQDKKYWFFFYIFHLSLRVDPKDSMSFLQFQYLLSRLHRRNFCWKTGTNIHMVKGD
jgi:hypothetical protein